jgi:hypothetical protein
MSDQRLGVLDDLPGIADLDRIDLGDTFRFRPAIKMSQEFLERAMALEKRAECGTMPSGSLILLITDYIDALCEKDGGVLVRPSPPGTFDDLFEDKPSPPHLRSV